MPAFQKDMGIGVGLRIPHHDRFVDGKPASVNWVEVISENVMPWQDKREMRALDFLMKVRANVPVVLHGVSMSIGSTDPLDRNYLKRLKTLARRVEPAWMSDHLCWTGVAGENLHDLLPLPYTEEALAHVVARIGEVQEFLGRRILIENVSSYLEFSHSTLTEWEFLAEVAKRADCGILLDVNNIFVSSFNHKFDPLDYLRGMPADRIGQVHLAGHSDNGTHLVDTHDKPVRKEVWKLYEWVCRNLPPVSTMIEWDGDIPAWEVLEAELSKAKRIREKRKEASSHVHVGGASATI